MKKINNKGFTLIETLLCFVILGIIMVIASQIIYSSTETYYLNRSVSYGMQAAQIVSTEIRGELEDALPMCLYDINNTSGSGKSYSYINISNVENQKYIEFISSNGNQIKLSFENEDSPVLNRYSMKAYDEHTLKKIDDSSDSRIYILEKTYDSKYIGMGYEIHDISFEQFKPVERASTSWNTNGDGQKKLDVGDYPILELTIKVGNNQYDEYECKEYISLYNFYGIVSPSSAAFGTNGAIINIQ